MPIEVGVGVSTEKDYIQATREAVRQARKNIRSQDIEVAVVFTSVEFAHSAVFKTIAGLLGPVDIIGCSSLAVISNQGIFQHGLAIMLLTSAKGIYYNTACARGINTKSAITAGEELGEKLLYGFKNIRRDLGVIFSDGLMTRGSDLINGMQKMLGRSFPLVGASASDDLTFKRTYLYFGQEVFSDAVCGILWGGRLNFGLGVKHGWKPLGKPRQVTKSLDNIIFEIDGHPAADLYEEYLDCSRDELKKQLKRISIFYPIGIYITGEEEYLLRNILSIKDDGSINLQGDVPQGSQIRLMIGTKESCIAATHQAINDVKTSLAGRPPKFAFVFNSASRYILLRKQIHEELEIIKEGLGKDTPIIGMYTYGEQAPLKEISYQGRTYFHNQTITILAIGVN